MNPLLLATALRYSRKRERAYRRTEKEIGLPAEGGRLSPITGGALERWEATWVPLHTGRAQYGEWDWAALRQQFRDPDRFEVAIWSGQELCGLAIGKASNGRTLVSVRFLEGSPRRNHPFEGRVIRICAAAADGYGLEIGAQKVHFVDPYPAVIPNYLEIGCHYVPPSGGLHGYCERVI